MRKKKSVKPARKSRTLWFNGIVGSPYLLEVIFGSDFLPPQWSKWIVAILVCGNFILRYLTSTPLERTQIVDQELDK